MPPERVLTESDGPFAQLDGASVMPWQTELAMAQLSELWSIPQESVQQMLLKNLQNLLPSLKNE
jgi:TatD DNase family protein